MLLGFEENHHQLQGLQGTDLKIVLSAKGIQEQRCPLLQLANMLPQSQKLLIICITIAHCTLRPLGGFEISAATCRTNQTAKVMTSEWLLTSILHGSCPPAEAPHVSPWPQAVDSAPMTWAQVVWEGAPQGSRRFLRNKNSPRWNDLAEYNIRN